MAFTEQYRVDIRKHCGFAMFGNIATQAFGYRYFQHYGTLEFRVSNASVEEEAIITKYVDTLNVLEDAIVGSSDNLDTNKAAVWDHNPREVANREGLYLSFRLKLCAFLGISPGPGIKTGGNIII